MRAQMKVKKSEDDWMTSGYDGCYYTGLLGKAWGYVHRLMERPFPSSIHTPRVLELGAGQGQHLSYVRHSFDDYLMTDLRVQLLPDTLQRSGIKVAAADAQDLSQFNSEEFDRVIATCLLAHLPDPLTALEEWRRVVRTNGWLTIYLPLEPSLANRLIRRVVIWPRARKNGLDDPELVMYQGHKIHYPALRIFMERTFHKDLVIRRRFPSRVFPWNMALFEVWNIKKCGD